MTIMENRKIIYTYNKAWSVERRIFGIGDVKLPKPVAVDTVLYIVLGFAIALILSKIPPFSFMSPTLLFGGFGVGLPILMRKARIHSKTPARFLAGYFSFLMQPKAMTRFQPIKETGAIRFTNVRHKPIEEKKL